MNKILSFNKKSLINKSEKSFIKDKFSFSENRKINFEIIGSCNFEEYNRIYKLVLKIKKY